MPTENPKRKKLHRPGQTHELEKTRWIVGRKGGHTSIIHVINRNLVAVARTFRLSTDKHDNITAKMLVRKRMNIFLEKYFNEDLKKIETTYNRGNEARTGHILFEVVTPNQLMNEEKECWDENIATRFAKIPETKENS